MNDKVTKKLSQPLTQVNKDQTAEEIVEATNTLKKSDKINLSQRPAEVNQRLPEGISIEDDKLTLEDGDHR